MTISDQDEAIQTRSVSLDPRHERKCRKHERAHSQHCTHGIVVTYLHEADVKRNIIQSVWCFPELPDVGRCVRLSPRRNRLRSVHAPFTTNHLLI